MARNQILFLLILSCLSAHTLTIQIQQQEQQLLFTELQEANLRIARLESVLEESIHKIDVKNNFIEEREQLIDDMATKIHDLQSLLSKIKDDSLHAEERLTLLEEEVRLLWTASRQNNFDIHVLESKAQDAEDRLEVVNSQVEKMADIVTEQWIHIQHLEQALFIIEMKVQDIQRKLRSTRCTFLKFVNDLSGQHLPKLFGIFDSYSPGKGVILNSYMSQALQQFKRFFSAFKKFHHERLISEHMWSLPISRTLQGLIKQEMAKNELTAALANEELVFFVASALITFPILIGWVLLSSHFS
ncbi:hypothetical protein LWI29_006741 [Acer saccharum]|uniref:Uncharacterized protein n=1 Tax=Acer saccharum TaxID=4024 RepID=A0AA39RTG7_ACESA|nr:hypothetical protein LWI29_006741 [Acer saccharum]